MYNLMKKVIEAGRRTGTLDKASVTERLDTFYGVGKLTTKEYEELTAMLEV